MSSRANTSTILSTDSLIPVMDACRAADERTLVIFDIDDVLVTMIDAVFQTNERYNLLVQKLNTYAQKEWFYFLWQKCSLSLIDNDIVNIIDYLRKAHIPTLALTFGYAGSIGGVDAFERIRDERLQSLGLEFNWSFNDQQPISFPVLAIRKDNPPLFDKGILHSCNVAKSKVLEEFLKHVTYKPTKIIFIDDVMINIDDLRQWCASQNIDYQGFHYTDLDHLITEFNEHRAHYQTAYLIEHGVWLSDQEADKLRAQL